MENIELARIFEEIADLLEVKGDNPFRIRSYRNASLIIAGFPESFKALLQKGEDRLKGIHGIGEGIREKIVELIGTGRCSVLDELLKELPPGILDLLKVSGIGPKKAGALYKGLGIASLGALEKAARTGKLRGLSGFGEKTEGKILKAIANLRSMSGRFKLSVARAAAVALVEFIKAVPGVAECAVAGSLRRWKDTVGDIDILATCKDPLLVMDAFTTHPDVKEIIAKGKTRSSVLLNMGLQADIRVVEKKAYGSALQYFTGGKAHNVALRDRAKRQGLKISEYGVFNEKTGKRIAGLTEAGVYESVGLPFISPELRENAGEIEAAEKGRLPDLVDVVDIRGDLHVHTNESDGGNTLAEMAEAAIKLGYEYLAVTDHSKAVGVAKGLDEARLLDEMKAIDAFNERLKKSGKRFRVLKGAEVDIRSDGALDHPLSVLDRLDCVVGAVHSGFAMPVGQMTERVIAAFRTGRLDIFAHPTGRLIGSRPPYAIDMERIMAEAKRLNVALEINSYPDRLDLNDVHARLAKDMGVKVVISTDSHSVFHLENIAYGVHTARRGWLEKKDVLNAMGLDELMDTLGRG